MSGYVQRGRGRRVRENLAPFRGERSGGCGVGLPPPPPPLSLFSPLSFPFLFTPSSTREPALYRREKIEIATPRIQNDFGLFVKTDQSNLNGWKGRWHNLQGISHSF